MVHRRPPGITVETFWNGEVVRRAGLRAVTSVRELNSRALTGLVVQMPE
jgi:hypothetical protein